MAGMNPMQIMKMMNMKKEFEGRHPRVLSFIKNELLTEIPEGTVIEMTVTKPGQAPVTGNMRVTAEDLEMIRELKNTQQ